MNFEFATASRIVFGERKILELPELARAIGASALVVVGREPDRTAAVRHALNAHGVSVTLFSVASEPTIDLVTEGAAQARLRNCDSVIGIGGGSVMDAAKAIAALATNRSPATEYLEVIGAGKPLQARPLPVIAIPTTAGSGAEVTRNAVLTSPEHQVKISLRHAWMAPVIALIDPELTRPMPPAITAASGMDALSQLIEPFVSSKHNPMADGFCREGLDRIGRFLRAVYRDGEDAEAREGMALASLFGGLALANSGLGAVHGFAAPFGAMFNAPHGAVCAALLAPVMRANIRDKGSPRFTEIARRLTGDSSASAEDGVRWVADLAREFKIRGLAHYGLTEDRFGELIEKARKASSMRANPNPLSERELAEILGAAM